MTRPAAFGRWLATGALALGAAMLLRSAPAAAYVRSRTPEGHPYFWKRVSVGITGYPQGFPDLTLSQITSALDGAATVWTRRDPQLASCTYLDIETTTAALAATPPLAGNDHVNNLLFHNTDWCPADAVSTTDCYDPAALALTAVTTVVKTGEIVDADIEVNAVNFVWADLVANPDNTGVHDLQNALTHEMGHFIGLDHTCWGGDPSKAPLDNTGAPAPSCTLASNAVRETTMFVSAAPGDLTKRTLSPDDQLAVCEIYAKGSEPPSDDGGCAVGGGGPPSRPGRGTAVALAVGAALAAFGARARRRARRTRAQPS